MAPAKVILRILSGPLAGRQYDYDSHDTFLFGRDAACHASVPTDRSVSRHHFTLEINPPAVFLRDLGSLNGTRVNGELASERQPNHATTSERRLGPHVVLKHGDVIAVGDTRISLEVIGRTRCRLCRALIPGRSDGGNADLCPACQRGTDPTGVWASPPQPVQCIQCKRDVTEETGAVESRDYVCESCRQRLRRSVRGLRAFVERQSPRNEPASGGRQLAGYVLDKVLGKGGMGVVYRGHASQKPSEIVAIKVILSDPASDETVTQRVLREIGIGLKLNHPRIVRVLAHGSMGNVFYVVMEQCTAGNLERLLKRYGGRLPVEKAIRLMVMCLEGMEHAHDRSIVHRDLKPANILLQKGSGGKLHPKISDFGLAKTLAVAGLSGMTATGTCGGSWHYMPREQLTNFKFVGPESDVWSLGATFYQVLTGKHPRDFPPKQDPIRVVLQNDAVPIRERDGSIPQALASMIDRALAADPSQRYPNAGAMRRALVELL